jgi:hypothetical protein
VADAERIGRLLSVDGLSAEQTEARSGLDALIACYVALKGPEALELVDRLFLDRKGRDVPFTETYAAVMALRFLGEESDLVPRDRVLASLRLLLEEPKLADLVIADLARWQDWSAVDRLVTLFKEAQADNIFVREPIVNYLRACPLPEAAAAITELEAIDPEAVRRAATLAGVAGLIAAAPPAADEDDNAGPPGPATLADPTALDTALAIAPVRGDEDPTDITAAEPPVAAHQAGPAAGGPTVAWWKWLIWAGVVIAIGIVSRAAMRTAATGEH